MVCSAKAQTNNTAVKFAKFFKANQADSIHNLFTAKMKSAINLEGTSQFLKQLKSQLGEIVETREMDAKVKGWEDMNHVLKKAPSDRMANLSTYNNESLPLHEEVIPVITSFIKKNTK
jgi:hypothetical protein